MLDLLVKGREQGPVGGEHAQRRGPFGAGQPQGLLRGLHDLFGLGSGQAHAAATNEAQHPFYAEAAHSVWVGQVADQHPQRGGVKAVGEAAGQPGEDQVELCVDLVGQHDLGGDLAATVRDPRRLRSQRLVTHLWCPAAAADQQFGHRAAVAGVVLQRAQQLLAAGVFHRSRVELNDLQTSRAQPRHQRPVIVARGLNADPYDLRIALDPGAANGCDEGGEACLGQGKLERRHEDLAVVISDQGDRAGLAHVHWDHQTALRIEASDPAHEPRLQLAVDERHYHSHLSDVTDNASDGVHRWAGDPAWRTARSISSTTA